MRHMRHRNNSGKKFNNTHGFSLLEILISVGLLVVIAGGVFATVTYSKRMAMQAEMKLTAISILEEELNNLKQLTVSGIPANTFIKRDENMVVNGKTFTINVETKQPPYPGDTDDPNLKGVIARANWTDVQGEQRSESLVTVLFGA